MSSPVLTSLQTAPGREPWKKMKYQAAGCYPMAGINHAEEELLNTPGGLEKAFININILKDYHAASAYGWKRDLSLEQARDLLLRHAPSRPGSVCP
jgi:hypothetical protein